MLLPITVIAATVQLSWNIPTLRADSTPLPISEISNYNIYYGKTSGIYNNEVTVQPGTLSHFTIVVPSTSTYFFVMTTVDTGGRESQYSNEVHKSFDAAPSKPTFTFR